MTTNPRGRNRVPLAATATAPARLAPISAGDAAWKAGVVERLQQMAGERGNPWERVQTRRDMQLLGLLGGNAAPDMPPDLRGVPVWTSRSRFELVTLAGLGAALVSMLATSGTATSAAVSAADFLRLKQRVDSLGVGGVSTAVLQQAVAQIKTQLDRDLAAAIARLEQSSRTASSQVATLQSSITQSLARQAITSQGIVVAVETPSAVWEIEHGLGRLPHVTALNDDGEEIHGDVLHVDANNVEITHGASITGTAILR